jgi:hypothetical protein
MAWQLKKDAFITNTGDNTHRNEKFIKVLPNCNITPLLLSASREHG